MGSALAGKPSDRIWMNQPHPEHLHNLVVDRKQTMATGVAHFVLRDPDGVNLPSWDPGAHIDIVLGDDMVRQYSLCGDHRDPKTYEIAVLREPDGRGGSIYLHDVLGEGQSVSVRGPRNHFPLVDSERYLFIAGGIGVTPLLPMVASVASSSADWRLVYGGRSRGSMAFRDEVTATYPG
jgi:ferredoxin-NADP reductase